MKTLSAAEEDVEYGGRVQPDWFKESSEVLVSLIDVGKEYYKMIYQLCGESFM